MFASLLSLLAVTGAAAQAGSKCETYSFQPNARLDVGAIKRLAWTHLGDDKTMTTSGGARLMIQPFDVEDRPTFGRWRALAVVYATRGDLAERTIGGILFETRSAQPIDLETARVAKDGGAVRVTLPASISCPAYVIRLEGEGTLLVQGRSIGRLP